MANIYGDNFSSTDALKKAPGEKHNAGVRRFSNSVDLAVEGGGTSNPLIVGVLPRGAVFDELKLASTANLSSINFTLGTADDPDKYMTTSAGPNAAIKAGMGLPAMRKMAMLEEDEEIILTPSANWPGTGIVEASIYASKR